MKAYALLAVAIAAIFLFGCISPGPQPPIPSPTSMPTLPQMQTPSFQTPTPAPTQTPAGTPTAAPSQSAAPTPAPTLQAASVEMRGFAFNPDSLTVSAGTTVTWTNSDSVPHTVTGDSGGALNSPTMPSGASWSFTFTQPGTYAYHCSIHTTMHGTITVMPPP